MVRILVTAAAAFATYSFVFWLPLWWLLLPAGLAPAAGTLMGAVCAFLTARWIWMRKPGQAISRGFLGRLGVWAMAGGVIGFSLGFFGPILLTPEANQGPLLGIFITGPLGVVVGALACVVNWTSRSK